MTIGLKRLVFGVAVLLLYPGHSFAAFITFQNLLIDRLDLAGTQTEGAFSYRATVGQGWEVQSALGNPASSLVTFYNDQGAFVGDKVEIALTGGGLFSFQAVDFRTITNSGSDQVTIRGFLAGNPTGTLLLNTSTTTFQTVASGFTGPIDMLQVQVTSAGSNAMALDNFNLTTAVSAVPEPSTLLLAALGTIGMLGYARRRRRAAAAIS